jgi:glyoxylase-like metal-dependent hydrolase (beta-lactamase superfamily II)
MVAKPTGITLRAYNVGFGDCFLLTFRYAAGDKHLLIDFGTTAGPKKIKENGTPALMVDVARHIQGVTGGRLDAVIATHRHRDHISGFARKKGKGSGDLIAEMAKDALILLPWTEHPDLAENATAQHAARRQWRR